MKRVSDKYSRDTWRDDAKIKKNVLRKEGEPSQSAKPSSKSTHAKRSKNINSSKTLRGVRR